MLTNLQQAEQDELNLKIIANSLEKASIKHRTNTLKIDKEYLTHKILDELKCNKAQALKYLNILDSRGTIIMLNQEITYNLKQENNTL